MSEHILMGCTEAAALLGVSRQRVSALWHTHPQFPEPIDVLSTGPVWWAADIKAFAEIPRPVGRPKKREKT